MNGCSIGELPHQPSHSYDFCYELTLTRPTYCRVARHQSDPLGVAGDQSNPRPDLGGSPRRFDPCVSSTYNDNVVPRHPFYFSRFWLAASV